jgi:hypothetical protein
VALVFMSQSCFVAVHSDVEDHTFPTRDVLEELLSRSGRRWLIDNGATLPTWL